MNKQNSGLKDDHGIIIITQGVSSIVLPLLNSRNKIIGIIEAAPRAKNKGYKKIFSILLQLVHMVISKADTLKDLAEKEAIPYYYMDNGSDIKLKKWVRNLAPSLIVVYSMSQLLKENIFTIPQFGTINLHPALLPKYRGPNPYFWMYYNMDLKPGVTVHYIDNGEDTGDIIYQESFDLPLGTKLAVLKKTLIDELGVPLLLKAIEAITKGAAPRMIQPEVSPTLRAKNIKKLNSLEFIDWQNWSIERIWHFLCGTEGFIYPKGYSTGFSWSIQEIRYQEKQEYEPSKIYKENGQYFLSCSEGKIFLKANFSLKNWILSFLRGC